jgi:large subunit ribosomal protein L35
MPKMKTHRGAAKRFKRTGSGAWKRAKANRGHLLGHKSQSRKRRLRKGGVVSASDQGRLKKLLPYL